MPEDLDDFDLEPTRRDEETVRERSGRAARAETGRAAGSASR